MRVLVTGSSGFIGRHLVDTLVARGHQVMGVASIRDDRVLKGYRFEECDVLDADRLIQITRMFSPDALIHLAARTDLEDHVGLIGYAANIGGVTNVLMAIRAATTVQRAIFTSTQLVCRIGYVPRTDEDYAPNTVYGESKVRTEQLVRENDGGGAVWCLVRPTTVWGPGMSSHYHRLLKMIQKGRYFHIGDVLRFRLMGYVGNVVHQYCEMLSAPMGAINKKTFYVADYEAVSVHDWTEALRKHLGGPKIRIMPPSVASLLAKTGDFINRIGFRRFPFNSFRLNNVMTEYNYDMAKTKAVCGELPYGLDAGAARTAQWYLKLAIR